MTRKDYELIADAIKDELGEYADVPGMGIDNSNERSAIVSTARAIADRLGEDNPNFDRERFLSACGQPTL